MRKHHNAPLAAGLLFIANLLVKVFGFLREILIAKYYGTSIYTDAYIIANNIPTVLFASIGASLASAYIPTYSAVKAESGEKAAKSFTLKLLCVVTVICLAITVLGEIFTRPLVALFASGFSRVGVNLTVEFTKVLLPSILGMVLMNLFGSYLQIREEFLPIALVPMISNLVIIGTLILSDRAGNIDFFVWGTLFGILAQILFYFPFVWRNGLFHGFGTGRSPFFDNSLRRLLLLVVPVFLGEAVSEVNSIVDRSLVSGLETGSVSALNYGHKLVAIIISVFMGSVMMVWYPKISADVAENGSEVLAKKAEKLAAVVFAGLVPLVFGVFVFGEEIVRLLFQRGNFDEESVLMVTTALSCYIIGMPASGFREVLTKGFYSLNDTKIPMRNGVFCAVLNIALDFLLIHVFGYCGAALASSAAIVVCTATLSKTAQRKGVLRLRNLFPSLEKTFVSALAVAVCWYVGKRLLAAYMEFGILYFIGCVMLGIIGLIFYAFLQCLMGQDIFIHVMKKRKDGR